jgi:DNA-directed RNA polymerase specialized sigma24 family protein
MSPRLQPLTAWLDGYSQSAYDFTFSRLSAYSILRAQSKEIAQYGVAEAFKRAERRRLRLLKTDQVDAFDLTRAHRWFCRYSYNEALRIVLDVTDVKSLLKQLSSEQQQLLQWRYIDQSSDETVATLFELYDTRKRINIGEARRQSWQGYRTLCEAIREDRRKRSKTLNEWDFQYLFPLFPGICREHQPL